MSLDMDPVVRPQWCAALRSGDYQQAKHELRQTVAGVVIGHCCLGVLTDLWLKAGHEEMIYDSADPAAPPVSVWDKGGGVLSSPVAEWAGLTAPDPRLRPNRGGRATGLNDSGFTFAEIADLIDGGAA